MQAHKNRKFLKKIEDLAQWDFLIMVTLKHLSSDPLAIPSLRMRGLRGLTM